MKPKNFAVWRILLRSHDSRNVWFLRCPLQSVEDDQATQRHQIGMMVERRENAAYCLANNLLSLGQFGKQVNKHVGDGYASGGRQPDAPRRAIQEPQSGPKTSGQ